MSDVIPADNVLNLEKSKQFFSQLQHAVATETLQKLVLSKYQGQLALKQVQIRPLLLKQQWQLSFTYKYQTNDITKNYKPDAALAEIVKLLGNDFFAAHLFTTAAESQITISKKGKCLYQHKLLSQSSSQPKYLLEDREKLNAADKVVNTAHNREKHRYLSLQQPFLQALGVTDSQQKLIPAMSKKWKQINKFIEIFSTAVQDAGLAERKQLHIADFGSGKAYLTFAMHDYVTNNLMADVQVTGVELRQGLVDLCNDTAKQLQLAGIQFEQGDVKHFKAKGINVMIALHACDTATDYALHMGIATGAEMIMCSPCCHKQIRPQIQLPPVLAPMLQHGIHLGQEAEMVTDSLRALLLEAHGYQTKVFEFISLEHTSKNKMILAIKRKQAKDPSQVLVQIAAIKQFYGIEQHCLEQLLAV
ncbi:class I SAM-dependent methyltransferase [Rheinheimera salexigens]|uniref:Methyltransferase n=1 Tax=Rheinheimera salexigens TaxID=1628148 RepID=A0A1E7Q6E8_9GAMM|nr:SAM-dependent methyltransferase [Rheinheimera salexigens]OEY69772.1 methyltransferase [Rheinheimera salexigens]